MGSEIRTSAPAHATGAVVFVSLDEIAEDQAFRLRPEGDTALLAASMGRLGQLTPVELRPWPGAASEGPRYQVVAGFRRLAGLKLLLRDRVLARVHASLSDEDAWGLALVHALTGEPLSEEDLQALRHRLLAGGQAPWAQELIDEARVRAPLPPEQRERFYEFLDGPLPARAEEEGGGEEAPTAAPTPTDASADQVEEVAADDFAEDLAIRMSELNQDLATAYAAWSDLPPSGRRLILSQARYVAELLPYLEDAER
ncbi:MAG: ParB N-terminal domain-containing protein [Deltaproteobacteria bacterium]|nr:ParB N-terminal domain-containing protein [Deltaproteobacteria bacterium]